MDAPSTQGLSAHVRRTLLYYEIFQHPLTSHELFTLLSMNTITRGRFAAELDRLVTSGEVHQSGGFYSTQGGEELARLRRSRELLAKRRIRIARIVSRIITLFPFVRGVFVSGDLSKGVAVPESDIDYAIVTAPGRLWICRTLLILFKKVFLLNKKKYFCLNFFVSEDRLGLDDRTYYTATEIAHLKPLYNHTLYLRFMNANGWVRTFLPNYRAYALPQWGCANPPALFQRIPELLFMLLPSAAIDRWLMERMKLVWARRYPGYDSATRERLFRCTPSESSAYIGNFSEKVLALYRDKLSASGLG